MKAPTPVMTKAVAKLLAQVQAEAQAATLEALSAKDGIVVLQDVDRETVRTRFSGDHFSVRDGRGARVDSWRHRQLPHEWERCPHIHHPAWWHVHESRVDGHGTTWQREAQIMVTDDFGTLVSVEGGAG